MKKLVLIVAMLMAFGLGGAAAFAATADKPPAPPGQPDCEHGNSGAQCKEDPQPNHGAECKEHGKKGGQNEDHCLDETTSTETTPGDTTPVDTTPSDTTPKDTTPQDTTPQETTPTETTPGNDPPSDTKQTDTPSPETPVADTSSPTASVGTDTYKPPVAAQATKAEAEPVAKVSSAGSKPSTAPQAAPFTP